ncbi:MAG TPA: hypothetical protein VG889_18020 [Rhizomicrobium sp.]|nr:hypothetical protein [Rhizomicrobium sp.]
MSRPHPMALAAVLVLLAGPAFALCNPGTPHCIKVTPGSTLDKLQKKMKTPGEVGGGDNPCKGVKPDKCHQVGGANETPPPKKPPSHNSAIGAAVHGAATTMASPH